LHATAGGRAILANTGKPDLDEVLTGPLESYSESTVTDPQQLREELERVSANGFALNRNQFRPGVCAIASAVLDSDGTPLAAVVISMPDSRFEEDRLPELGRLVAETAKEISARRLGS
jgi:IclR family acetate operon transcriptional repressor